MDFFFTITILRCKTHVNWVVTIQLYNQSTVIA